MLGSIGIQTYWLFQLLLKGKLVMPTWCHVERELPLVLFLSFQYHREVYVRLVWLYISALDNFTVPGESFSAVVWGRPVAPAISTLSHYALWLPALSSSAAILGLGWQGSVNMQQCRMVSFVLTGEDREGSGGLLKGAERILHMRNIFSIY